MSPRAGRPRKHGVRLTFGNVFVLFCVVAVPVMLIGPGLWLLGQRAIGTPVQATVLACQERTVSRSYAEYCQARWVEDGRVVDARRHCT